MFRGALIWLGLCLSIVVLWRIAEATAAQERMLQDAYSPQSVVASSPEEGVPLGAAARPAPRWHECAFQPMDCDEFGCERRALSSYSRFQ